MPVDNLIKTEAIRFSDILQKNQNEYWNIHADSVS